MKLMTWNIQWCRGMDGRVDPERIMREARNIVDFDVLCLQEVAVNFKGLAGSAGEDQPARLAAALPGYAPVFVAATDVSDGRGGRSQFGNIIFSRLPVKQVFRHLLPWPADPRFPSMQRAVLEAVVAAAFGDVRVMTTHLEYYSAAQRMIQVEAIRRLHQEACAHTRNPGPSGEPGEPIFDCRPRSASAIITGDMNVKPEWEEHDLFLRPFDDGAPAFRDAWQTVHPHAPHAPTVDAHQPTPAEPPYCCDYIFVTEDVASRITRAEVAAQTAASDHQPLWVALAD